MEFLDVLTAQGTVDVWGLVVIAVLLFAAGFVDAIAGGGGFISLPAFLFAGLPVHLAIGTNKLSATMGTTIATAKYIREGYMVWWLVPTSVLCALGGSSLGASLSLATNEHLIKIFMLLVIPFATYYILRTKRMDVERAAYSRGATILICAVIAFVLGMYDGFYGPGTGTFLMLALPAIAHLTLDHAAGITKAINLSTNAAALVVFWTNGAVLVVLGLVGGAFNIVGNYLGARAFTTKGAKIVRPMLLLVMALFAIKLVTELLGVA